MITRDITLIGFLILALAVTTAEIAARRARPRLPSAAECLGYLMRRKIGRVAVLASWWWIGWHFFAR